MPGLVEIPTPFHYIREEQKAVPNPETGLTEGLQSLQLPVGQLHCLPLGFSLGNRLQPGFSQCNGNLHRLQYGLLHAACLFCGDAPGQSSRVFPRVSITVTRGRAVKCGGVGGGRANRWEAACFFGSAQVSGMAKQGLYLTWMSPLTFLQPFKNNLLRDQ